MAAESNRLDRLLSRTLKRPLKQIRLDLAQGLVRVEGQPCFKPTQLVHRFTYIEYNGEVIQNHQPVYLCLHKPKGVVCATTDPQHKTVIDLVDHPLKHELHIVGRLDLNSTGLVLLTNDSRWSKSLTDPNQKVSKVYEVTLEQAIVTECVQAFENGMFFEYEGKTTAPARLTLITPYQAQVILTEGKYHQIKRMFGRFRNPVLKLHRTAIGRYQLPPDLLEGQWKTVMPG